MRRWKHVWRGVFFVALAAIFVVLLVRSNRFESPLLGVTFSRVQAQSLGLDWEETYGALLTDLAPDHMRIPVYWSEVEGEEGTFDFAAEDWMLDEASAHNVSVTLAIGQKVPRWPECYLPAWVKEKGEDEREVAVLRLLRAVVERYDAHPAVRAWQVENEPFLQFGVCPPPDLEFFKRELELVRSISQKPLVMTTSGELEPWFQTVPFADHVGFSLYRLTWNPVFGFWFYPLQANAYRARIAALKPFASDVYVSELQAEPWFHRPVEELSIEDQHQMFSPRMMRENVRFARRLSVPLVDLWGVEWWWYMKEHGDASLWDAAREIFQRK